MRKQEQIALLKESVTEWNKWRAAHPGGKIDLNGAKLTRAKLNGADLRRADLNGAYLNEAFLNEANLRRADLNGAKLNGAELIGADLNGADLNGAFLNGARIGSTSFGDVDLSGVNGLDRIRHSYPSTIGIDLIYRSKGRISKEFLLKAGVPDVFVTYMEALTSSVIEYRTCFISFAEEDDIFSETLYNDLVNNGVRSWRWKEDAEWGGKMWANIDKAIREYEKLVVILSEASLKNPNVIREIERALAREVELQKSGEERDVLFPIRVDGAIFNWDHYLSDDVRSRNIGDFEGVGKLRGSKQKEKYGEKFLKRLVADLKKVATIK